MKEIGLEDLDMKVLDEDNSHFRDMASSSSSCTINKSSNG